MDEKILAELRKHANSVLSKLNVELSEVADKDFQQQLRDSVSRMERDRRLSAADIEIAKQNYTKFINAMYSSRERRIGGKDIMRYKALNESKSSLCPLWPIC